MSTQIVRPNAVEKNLGPWTVVGAPTIPEAVDEETSDDDTTYTTCSSVTGELALNLQNHGIPADGIFNSVTVGCTVRREAGAIGDVHVHLGLRIADVNYMVAETDTVTAVYALLSGTATVNPATGLAWTAATINAAHWQFRIITLDIPRAVIRITQAWAEIDYSIPTFTRIR